jgi:hypothetical protein
MEYIHANRRLVCMPDKDKRTIYHHHPTINAKGGEPHEIVTKELEQGEFLFSIIIKKPCFLANPVNQIR